MYKLYTVQQTNGWLENNVEQNWSGNGKSWDEKKTVYFNISFAIHLICLMLMMKAHLISRTNQISTKNI